MEKENSYLTNIALALLTESCGSMNPENFGEVEEIIFKHYPEVKPHFENWTKKQPWYKEPLIHSLK